MLKSMYRHFLKNILSLSFQKFVTFPIKHVHSCCHRIRCSLLATVTKGFIFKLTMGFQNVEYIQALTQCVEHAYSNSSNMYILIVKTFAKHIIGLEKLFNNAHLHTIQMSHCAVSKNIISTVASNLQASHIDFKEVTSKVQSAFQRSSCLIHILTALLHM